MDLFTSAEMRTADQAAARAGVSEAALMARAGQAVADAAAELRPQPRTVLVLCGAGNNGGDGYVAARLLEGRGLSVHVLALKPGSSRAGAAEDARSAWAARREIGTLDGATLSAALADADVVIDALFGSGLSRPLDGGAAEVTTQLNAWSGPVVAVDVPSGIDADRAVPPGPHLRATHTVQLGGACSASALPPARFAFGTWTVADIGLPAGALPAGDRPELITDAAAAAALPDPSSDVHKGRAGRLLILAGSAHYAGAAELACRGAHRGGAGLVTLVTTAPFPARWPETIVFPSEPGPEAILAAVEQVGDGSAARVFGPGLDPADLAAVEDLVRGSPQPTLLDASALDEALRGAVSEAENTWLTPHVGEAARLLGTDPREVTGDPIHAARSLATQWRTGVVLKSAGAVVASRDGRIRVIAAGHPGMASGGSGDVLAGLLGAMLAAPHDDALARVAAGVHLHGRAGEHAARSFGLGLRASDLAERIPRARRALHAPW